MKRIALTITLLLAVLSLRAQNIPPVGEAKIIAIQCGYCGLIDLEKGETHKSDCPYANAGSGEGSSSSYGGGSYETYGERHEDAWNERQAAKAARKAAKEAKKAAKYARAKKVKLKDYQPMAGKTVVAGFGATDNTQVIAKYDRKGVPSYGLKNKATGKWVRKPQFQGITIVAPGVAAAKLKGKVGLLDPDTGQEIQNFSYDKYQAFHYPDNARNTVVALGKTSPDGKEEWHLMKADENGVYTEGLVCSNAPYFYEDGTGRKILYRRDDTQKVGMLDEFGREILPPVFDGLKNLEFSVDNAAYYQARKGSAVGVIDETGRLVVPCVYDNVDAKSWGKYGIRVEKNGKKGTYDIDGNQVFPPIFDSLDLEYFYDGNKSRGYVRGWVTDGDGKRFCALYDTHGNRLTDFSDSWLSASDIRDKADQLEEYRIY